MVMMEYFRFRIRKKKKRLIERSSVPGDINIIRQGKNSWRQFRMVQDEMRRMFPGLVEKEKESNEQVRSDKGDKEEHRAGYY